MERDPEPVSNGSDFVSLDFDFESEAPVPCLLCDETFEVTRDSQPFLEHILATHSLLIGEVEQVADLRQYVMYWSKLRGSELRDYCVVFNTNSQPGVRATTDTFFLLCDKLPEDHRLRLTLRQLKLRFIVEQKEKERNDSSFSRKCIYCSQTISGGVTQCLRHLAAEHSFALGNPDNIVYGAQLLDVLQEKLTNLVCLYCEKVFGNHKMLRDHMRKHQHRCLNPKNKIYDKFYLRNYLRPGTPWEETKRDLDGESDTESVGEWEGGAEWREDDTPPTTCLFCQYTTVKVPRGLFNHMKVHHNFDFEQITVNLNFYQKVKIINYIRSCIQDRRCPQCQLVFGSVENLEAHMSQASHCHLPHNRTWELHQYHCPVLENDGLLYHIEDNGMDENNPQIIPLAQSVIPEDVPSHHDSILRDPRLRQQITQPQENGQEGWEGADADEDDDDGWREPGIGKENQGKWREGGNGVEGKCQIRGKWQEGGRGIKGKCREGGNGMEGNWRELGSGIEGKWRDVGTGIGEEDGAVMCLFCRYTSHGSYADCQVRAHMTALHCINLTEVIASLPFYTQVKLINYIRWKTSQSECYVCGLVFKEVAAMEEHRVLAGHTTLPNNKLFMEKRWLRPVLEGDGLLQRLREAGDSDDEDPNHPDTSRGEAVYCEEVLIPKSILSIEAVRRDLLDNMTSYVGTPAPPY